MHLRWMTTIKVMQRMEIMQRIRSEEKGKKVLRKEEEEDGRIHTLLRIVRQVMRVGIAEVGGEVAVAGEGVEAVEVGAVLLIPPEVTVAIAILLTLAQVEAEAEEGVVKEAVVIAAIRVVAAVAVDRGQTEMTIGRVKANSIRATGVGVDPWVTEKGVERRKQIQAELPNEISRDRRRIMVNEDCLEAEVQTGIDPV